MNYNLKLELLSIVGCLPLNFESNSKEGFIQFGNEIDKIIRLTGINKRHIATKNMSSLDLGFHAAEHLIKVNNIDKSKVSILINVSYTFENRLPGDSNKISYLLGLNKSTFCIDISSACSGYLNALLFASTFLSSIEEESFAIIIDGDVQSKFVSKTDRATYPVFADASTASLLTKSNLTSFINFLSLGEHQDELCIRGFSSKSKPEISDFNLTSYSGNNSLNNFQIYMNGLAVYNFVINDVSNLIRDYVKNLIDKIDFFVPHQANDLITKALAKKVGLIDKLLISSNEFGNVGSCSIPLTIARHLPIKSGKKMNLLLSGFGAGLAANCGTISTSENFISDILFLEGNNEN
jgi:3-oxoacyl-[acyl-carrier-protein] synthase-3